MTILAVDNNALSLVGLEYTLKSVFPGGEILVTTDPLRAVQLLHLKTVDYIYSAVSMRPMDGFTLLHNARKKLGGIPVYLTGKGEKAEQAKRLGASGYLRRPVTVEAVRHELLSL